ncbi:F-box protein At4g09920-like [Rutidosis leptorrhynchoides]|uniref:F-box protein At4g09920-like n=1 Tax=Rutidosis leptorrhynchoides TaxID=125765 RepID=UPI003A999BF3
MNYVIKMIAPKKKATMEAEMKRLAIYSKLFKSRYIIVNRMPMINSPANANKLHGDDASDRISKLPDDVLCRILSNLQTKEAVATSILSKRWEHVWTSMPNLEFSDHFHCCNDLQTDVKMFKSYVDNVLSHHNGNVIEKCRLTCYSEYASSYIYSWVCSILCCMIQELTIQSTHFQSEVKHLPFGIFTCKKLVVLKIEGGFVLNLPMNFCLPNLKTLNLDSVIYVDDDSVQRLFSGFPCRQDLDIKRNGWDGVQTLSISVPSLKRLSIIFSEFNTDRDYDGHHETMINAPNSILHDIIRDHDFPIFQNLSQLELGVAENIDWRLLPNFSQECT